MQRAAIGHYSSLRLVWPDVAVASESRDITRINAHMKQDADGKWRVGQEFTVGRISLAMLARSPRVADHPIRRIERAVAMEYCPVAKRGTIECLLLKWSKI